MTFKEAKQGSLSKWDKPRRMRSPRVILKWWKGEGSKRCALCDYDREVASRHDRAMLNILKGFLAGCSSKIYPCDYCPLHDPECNCCREYMEVQLMFGLVPDTARPLKLKWVPSIIFSPAEFRQRAKAMYNRIENLKRRSVSEVD